MNYIFFADGFEDIEALATVDILRRAELPVRTVSINDAFFVKSASGMVVKTDCTIAEITADDADFIILPGGMPGTNNLFLNEQLKKIITNHFAAHRNIAAICAAPLIIGQLGLLKGKNVVCYPGFETYLFGANILNKSVVQHDNLITGKGPGVSLEFALKIVEVAVSKQKADEIAAAMQIA